jgi:hypothetical protein
MMFLESPWPILIIGLAAEVVLAVILIQTGRGALLAAMAGVAAVVGIGLLVEHFAVTDRKLITQTLDEAAAAVEANDPPRVLALLASDADETRSAAKEHLGKAEFVQVKIFSLEIHVVRTTSPPTAKATFNVLATGKWRNGEFGEQTLRPFPMFVGLRYESGRWLITSHKFVEDPRGG